VCESIERQKLAEEEEKGLEKRIPENLCNVDVQPKDQNIIKKMCV